MGWEWIVFAVVAVAAVAASAMSAYGMYQQGQTQKKVMKYNAEVAEEQAKMQKMVAADRAADIRARNRRMIAAETARASASGLALEPGTSPMAVLAYDAREGELDALRAEWSGDASARATTAEASMMRLRGRHAAEAANWQAGTTILGGVQQVGTAAMGAYGARK
jgi:hypothetical protein